MIVPTATTHMVAKGEGDAVVLLHCLGSDHEFWNEVSAHLASDFLTISYDFPGHGKTPVPSAGYTIQDLSEHCVALIRDLGLTSVRIVGISLGGVVALHIATHWPALVAGLVVADTAPKYSQKMAQILDRRARSARLEGMPAVVDETLNTWFTAQALEANTAAVRYARRVLTNTPVEGYALACAALVNVDLSDALTAIRCPTLVVCGNEDAAFADSCVDLARRIDGARMQWLSPAKHASILEHGGAFATDIRAFFAK